MHTKKHNWDDTLSHVVSSKPLIMEPEARTTKLAEIRPYINQKKILGISRGLDKSLTTILHTHGGCRAEFVSPEQVTKRSITHT